MTIFLNQSIKSKLSYTGSVLRNINLKIDQENIIMATVYDVPPEKLIEELAKKFKEANVEMPDWAMFVATGIHREKAPVQEDWWYTRLASVLRKVYIMGPIGASRLASEYGGKVDRGTKKYHAAKGSRSIIRKSFQQLEKLGYIKVEKKGRVVTDQGRAYLDKLSGSLIEKK